MKISFLIVSNRSAPFLERLVKSIAEQRASAEYQLIIVNNGFPDEQEKALTNLADSYSNFDFKILRDGRKPGKVLGLQTGLRSCKGEYISLLDDDNAIEVDFLENLLGVIERNPDVGGIAPDVLPIWECDPAAWVVEAGLDCLSYSVRAPEEIIPDRELFAKGRRIGMPSGGGMIVHRDVAKRFMELPEEILRLYRFHFDQELWFGLIPLSKGAVRTSKLRLMHNIPASRTKFRYQMWLNYIKLVHWARINLARRADCTHFRMLLSSFQFFASILLQFFSGKLSIRLAAILCARSLGVFCGTLAAVWSPSRFEADAFWPKALR